MTKSCCGDDEPRSSHNHDHDHNSADSSGLKGEVITIAATIVLFTVGLICEEILHHMSYWFVDYVLFTVAYLLSGWSVLTIAGKNILRGRFFDENFLMTIATLGAFAIHKLPEAVAVMLFYKIGELFQDMAIGNSRRSIKALLEVRPDVAFRQTESGVEQISPESVSVGEVIIVKAGEKIPLDGEVIAGNAQLNTAALTGESVPRTVDIGDTVLSGMINETGYLTVRVTKVYGESSIAKILDLVENASSQKAETEKFITKFARIYTPIVVFISLAVATIPPLVIQGATQSEWFYRALVILVISCPCGLVISIPLGYFGGVGGAAKRGILVKGSTFLDTLAAVKVVAFDKTGTLTQGNFKVAKIAPSNGFTESELLEIAAKVEARSNHPIAKSILEAYGKEPDLSDMGEFEEIAGHGVRSQINYQTGNQIIFAGNERLLQREHIAYTIPSNQGTIVHLAVDHVYAGYIQIADELKGDADQAIKSLKQQGIYTVMLTGDRDNVAKIIAERLGVNRYYADLLPEGKVDVLDKLLKNVKKGEKVAFVGDGINDAPVLARSDVGIAMGGLGSDAAIETADVVLMTDAPSKVSEAIVIGQKTHLIVLQNIYLAMGIKGLFIVLGSFGVANMWEAIFADVGMALLAIANATRVLK
ncbi:heavy metal translocating P-type ATPase [Phormidium tenue]|uniref:Cadmium-translocating P-type ATPase n=1 Tax=Phormidium tenue FACHB-1050 TaxID=2692857 RepID=A0ABR8C8W6_9CYAN|nr:heavy metal translocating P-type ATPase [Phormidium tenue]MBD2316530.1 cadmium-translocating P-type ATPase [Phormidium tenue FACHB-1050]